jgi:hypothetical protein
MRLEISGVISFANLGSPVRTKSAAARNDPPLPGRPARVGEVELGAGAFFC